MVSVMESFELESGVVLRQAPVAYETWGTLNDAGDNAVLVCHALTGNASVDDWWSGVLGPGKWLDTNRYFIVAQNVLGSCYGTAGPLTTNPETGFPYGASFPEVTVRDAVRFQRRLLEQLGIRSLAFVTGGSMGGMHALEWAYEEDFARALIPIGVGARHSAWCIGLSETQRLAITSDPNYLNGAYAADTPPANGLALARMIAMISYRSRTSFEARFDRRRMPATNGVAPLFSVESYLHYQGQKLVERFDANSYLILTRMMDTHDISRGRGTREQSLAAITQPVLAIGIDTDILYPIEEQRELADGVANGRLKVIQSEHGHDAFLIEFDQLNAIGCRWLAEHREIIGVG